MFAQVDITTERILNDHGLAVAIVVLMLVLFVLFVWKYGGKLMDQVIDGVATLFTRVVAYIEHQDQRAEQHAQLMKQCSETLESNRTCLDMQAKVILDPLGPKEYSDHLFSTHKTNVALLLLSRAVREGCLQLPDERQKKITEHLDEIERLLHVK